MTSSLPPRARRAVFASVLLFSSGVVLGGATTAVGFWLGASRPGPAPLVRVATAKLEPVAGTAVEAPPPTPSEAPAPLPAPPVRRDAGGVIERALGFAVSVRAGPSYGAGALVAEGVVLTAHHVVERRPPPELRFRDGEWVRGEVLAIDEEADLALIGFEGDGRAPAPITSALEVSLGDGLISVGTPRELSFTVHRGDVTYVGRRFDGVRYLQTDLPANPGSSGGPVVDAAGRLVGVMSFVLRGSEGIAFVTPVDYASGIFEQAGVPLGPLAEARGAFEAWHGERP